MKFRFGQLRQTLSAFGSKLPSSESVKNVVEILAIIAAAIWFITRGETSSRLNISAEVQSLRLTENTAWLRCDAKIENVGSMQIQVRKATVWLQQMLPLDDYIAKRLNSEKRLLKEGARVVDWPLISEIERAEKITVNPGEVHDLSWEFQVPKNVEVVRIYIFLADSPAATAGWTLSRVHSVNWTKTPVKESNHE